MCSNKINEVKFKMTDDDVLIERKKIASLDQKELNLIFTGYAQCINSILVMTIKQTKDEEELVELERLKRLINFISVDERFIRTKDKLWASKDFILAKDEKFFLSYEYNDMIASDEKKEFIEGLIDSLRDRYINMTTDEKELYWSKAKKLIIYIAKFKKLANEYEADK